MANGQRAVGDRMPLWLARLFEVLLLFGAFRRSAHWLQRRGLKGRTLVIAVPYLWLLLFFLIPFVLVLKISFAETQAAVPPYTPLFDWVEHQYLQIRLNAGNYLFLLKDSLYAQAFLSSLKVASLSTVLCLLLGYPMAYGIARANASWRNMLLLLVILPFWTAFLIRIYALMTILQRDGLERRADPLLDLLRLPAGVQHGVRHVTHSIFLGVVLVGLVAAAITRMSNARARLAHSRPICP